MSEPTSMVASIGRRVIAQDTADEVGAVKRFVVGRSGRRIERVQVAGRTRNAQMVEWSDLSSFGADAVMIPAVDGVHDREDDRDAEVLGGDVAVLGARVLDTQGFEHGTVADFEFDADTGEITSVLLDGHGADRAVPAEAIRALGTWALVVDPF